MAERSDLDKILEHLRELEERIISLETDEDEDKQGRRAENSRFEVREGRSTGEVVLISGSAKLLHETSDGADVAWKATIKNSGRKSVVLSPEIEFVDDDEFLIEGDLGPYLEMAPSQEETISSSVFFERNKAELIAAVHIHLEPYG